MLYLIVDNNIKVALNLAVCIIRVRTCTSNGYSFRSIQRTDEISLVKELKGRTKLDISQNTCRDAFIGPEDSGCRQ